MGEYIFVSATLFIASFTLGTAGFGFALVSVPFLSLSLAPRFVVPFVLVYAYGMNLFLLSRFRSHIQWPRVWPLMLGAAPGIPIGIYILKTTEALIVRNAVGVIIILFVLWSLFVRGQKTYDISRPWAFATGFASGIISSAFAMPGPPVLIYLALNRWEKNLTRATLQFYFFFTGTCSLLGQVLTKVLTIQVLTLNLLYLPVVIAGGAIGYLTFKRLSSNVFNKVLLYVLLAVGLFLVFS